MSSILLTGGQVITMDAGRRVLDGGFVAIRDDRIEAVGPGAAQPDPAGFERVIDARRMAILPGFIDCHAHAGHGLVKSLGADDGDAWYDACEQIYTRASSAAFWGAEAALAALERLRFGVTCGVSLLGGGDSILRTDSPEYAASHAEAVRDVGVRCVLAVGPCRPPFPRHFVRWAAQGPQALEVSFEQQLGTAAEVIDCWHGRHGQRINVCVVSPTLRDEHWQGASAAGREQLEAQARSARALSRERGVLFTQDGHTRGSVRLAHQRLDLLGADALLSHATDLDADEIAICAATGACIAHNPSAVASIRGRCPVPELIDAGVTVGLGSDATAPDRSADMLRHVQQCMHYHRRHFRDPGVLPPGKALEMVTIDAARALGMDHLIGSLEPGKKADVIALDLFRAHLVPLHMPVYRVAYFANGNDVDTVIVDGRLLMRGRRVRSVREAQVLEHAHAQAEQALERAGLEHLLETPQTIWGRSHY